MTSAWSQTSLKAVEKERARAAGGNGAGSRLVQPSSARSEKPWRGTPSPLSDRFRRVIAQAAKDADLGKHVHPHMLRHTFASHAMMRRVPVQVIQKWLGHANVTTTERYAHLRPDTGDDLINLLAPSAYGAR